MPDAAPWPWVNRGLACGSLLHWHQHRAPVSTTAGITESRAASAPSTRRGSIFMTWMIFIHAADCQAVRACSATDRWPGSSIENADGRRDASGRTHWRPNQVLSMMTSAGPFNGIPISIFFSGSHYARSCQWIRLHSFLPSRLGTSSRLIIKRWRIVGKLGHEASNG